MANHLFDLEKYCNLGSAGYFFWSTYKELYNNLKKTKHTEIELEDESGHKSAYK